MDAMLAGSWWVGRESSALLCRPYSHLTRYHGALRMRALQVVFDFVGRVRRSGKRTTL